jgi:hypothetical protein
VRRVQQEDRRATSTVGDGSMHATGQCTLAPLTYLKPSILTHDNSINMSLIKAALVAIKALELGEKLLYIKIAYKHRVYRLTLS